MSPLTQPCATDRRRHSGQFRCVLFVTACLIFDAAAASAAPPALRRPNLLILLAEQLPQKTFVRAMNSDHPPQCLDRLWRESMSFDQYVVNTPGEACVQATLWTGMYASTSGVFTDGLQVHSGHECLGHRLRRFGYVCDYVGRRHPGSLPQNSRPADATDPHPSPELRFGFIERFESDHDSRPAGPAGASNTAGRKALSTSDRAILRLKQHAQSEQQFAMVVALDAAAEDPEQRNTQNTVSEIISRTDVQTDQILRVLEETGTAENTVVIFTAVSGSQALSRSPPTKPQLPPDFHDMFVRVPLLIRHPGRIPAGRRSAACISSVDLLPTICGILAVGPPDDCDGLDLSDSTRVDCSCEPDFAFLQGMMYRSAPHTEGPQEPSAEGGEWRAIRSHRYTYARRRNGTEFLYDNRNDPDQTENLIENPDFTDVHTEMRSDMQTRMLVLRDEFHPGEWYLRHWTENGAVIRGARGDFGQQQQSENSTGDASP